MDYADADHQIRAALAAYELAPPGGDDIEVRVIREVIHARLFDRHLTVGDALATTGLRDHNVQTRYHRATGETVWQYITRRRMEVAMHLLENTLAPVYLIGRAVGYTCTETFTRAFKRATGAPPLHHRRSRSIASGGTKSRRGSRQIVKQSRA